MGILKKYFYHLIAKYGLKKPEMADLLELRYGNINCFVKTGINRLCYLARFKRIMAVTSVTLELSTYCNLRCTICPVNHDMKRKKGFMSFDLVKKVISENPGLAFVLLYHWGEPLMHPDIIPIIQYVKNHRINAFLTTNGTLLNNKNTRALLDSGLDRLTISMDGIGTYYERIRQFSYLDLEKNIIHLLEERKESKSNLKVDLDMTITDENEENVQDFRKKWDGIVDAIRIHPLVYVGGNSNFTRTGRCNEVWRGNLIVLWDGRVVPCCVDYEGELVLGDVNYNSLQEIINGSQAISLRKALLNGKFPLLCQTCGEYETKEVNPRFS